MITNDLPTADLPTADIDRPLAPGMAASPAPELGDVIDAIDDAASSLKSVVKNEADSLLMDFRSLIRDQPITSIAIAGALAYLIGRVGR